MQGSTTVAVKFVAGQSKGEQERFLREVVILQSLHHTKIVQFLGASMVENDIMLVTECVLHGLSPLLCSMWASIGV